MEPFEPARGRGTRLAFVAIGLLALLAVVAFASRSGLGHRSSASPTPAYLSYALSVFLIVFVLAIPVAVYSFVLQVREGETTRTSVRTRMLRTVATAGLFVLIASIALWAKQHHLHLFELNTRALTGHAGAPGHHKGSTTRTYQPHFEWIVLWIVVALGLVGLAAALAAHRRRRAALPAGESPTVEKDLAASITDAIGDLEAEPDPRRAVIAAYARMEGVLGQHGLHRRPSETPLEYLQRILLGVTGRRTAVRRLTSLFEQAKFSRHEIDASMKHDAIAALREIRDDLHDTTA